MPRVKDQQRYRKIYSYYRPKPIEESIGGVDEVVIQGLDWKQSVIAATTTNVTATLPTPASPYYWPTGSGVFTVDGVTIENEDRILIKDQLTGSQNGIYLFYSSSIGDSYWFIRSLDAAQDTLTAGAAVFVEEGTDNADCAFVLTTNDPIDVGTTSLTWVKFAGGGGGIFTTSGSYAKTTYGVAFNSDNTYPTAVGPEVFFYVSGTVSGSGVDKRVAVFGGDILVSGSFSQGLTAAATGLKSHAQGLYTTAGGAYSHAEGNVTNAVGTYSHAEGYLTYANQTYSHAEGSNTSADGTASHAEGVSTFANGQYSHAEGDTTTASGYASHAEGEYTKASGYASHAAGYGSDAVGIHSYAGGYATIASGSAQHSIGRYNSQDNDSSLFVIGNGSDGMNRSDVLRVEINGLQVTGSTTSTLGFSGSLTTLIDGTSYLVAGENVVITSASNGQVVITAITGSGGGNSYFGSTTDGAIFTSGSAAFVGPNGTEDSPVDFGSDVFFYVSGSYSGAVSVFGGNAVVSGSLGVGGPASENISSSISLTTVAGRSIKIFNNREGNKLGNTIQFPDNGNAYLNANGPYTGGGVAGSTLFIAAGDSNRGGFPGGDLHLDPGSSGTVGSADGNILFGYNNGAKVVAFLDRGSPFGGPPPSDVWFFVSGSTGNVTSPQRRTLFGGDVVVSGSRLMNVISGTTGPTYTVGLGDHLTVFTENVITASLPLAACVGASFVFKDGTGLASTSPQMISCSSGIIDGSATYTLPAVNYTAVTVVKVSEPDTWVII